jgi:hypothetical protein
MTKRIFIAYYRVSTEKQGRSGLGLQAQQEAVRSYLNGSYANIGRPVALHRSLTHRPLQPLHLTQLSCLDHVHSWVLEESEPIRAGFGPSQSLLEGPGMIASLWNSVSHAAETQAGHVKTRAAEFYIVHRVAFLTFILDLPRHCSGRFNGGVHYVCGRRSSQTHLQRKGLFESGNRLMSSDMRLAPASAPHRGHLQVKKLRKLGLAQVCLLGEYRPSSVGLCREVTSLP